MIKYPVTPAEIILLRAIHGEDAVINIELVDSVERSTSEEKERLLGAYKTKTPDSEAPLVEVLFPGYDPRLPVSLKDLRLDDAFMNLGASKLAPWLRPAHAAPAAKARAKFTKASAPVPVEAPAPTEAPDPDDED